MGGLADLAAYTGKLKLNRLTGLLVTVVLFMNFFTVPALAVITANVATPTPMAEEKVYPDLDIENSATSAVVMDASRNRLLYAKFDSTRSSIPAASKIMTAIMACDRLSSLDTLVTISNVAAAAEDASDSPDGIDLDVGDKFSLEYLLMRLLFYDSDSAALAIAEQIAGEESLFVEQMNTKAAVYELADTYFVNCTGETVREKVDTANAGPMGAISEGDLLQYSTAEDVALLTAKAMDNTSFARLFGKSSDYLVLDGQSLVSMRSNIQAIWALSEDRVTGAFLSTKEGNITTISVGKVNEIDLVTVTVGGTLRDSVYDTIALYDGCADYYIRTPLVQAGEKYSSEILERTIDGELFGLIYKNTVYYTHPKNDDFLKNTARYRSYGPFSRPIQSSLIAGQVIFELKDSTVIAVDVGPDRQILSKITILAEALGQLQSNRNLTIVLIACLCVLVLVLTGSVVRSLIESVKLIHLISLENRGRTGR